MWKRFSEIVKKMAEWAKAHTPKGHHSGSVANQGVLSRLIAFQREERAFSWTRKRKAVAFRMDNEPNQMPGTIFEALGCSVRDVLLFSRRKCLWWCKESLIWNVFKRAIGDFGR
jgi:hypothetical protein